jgi:hypothetical protein
VGYFEKSTGVLADGAHCGTVPLPAPTLKTLSPAAILRRWYWCSRLRALLPELCSLIPRIRMVFELRSWELGGRMGPMPQMIRRGTTDEERQAKRAYTGYIPQIMAEWPFLTIVDRCLMEQAWMAGWEYRSRSHSGNNRDETQS